MVEELSKVAESVTPIFSRDVADILEKSVSQVNRLAASGELPIIGKTPGLRGAYIFDRDVIVDVAMKVNRHGMTFDSLARELGCSLTDIADLIGVDYTPDPEATLTAHEAVTIAIHWQKSEDRRLKVVR